MKSRVFYLLLLLFLTQSIQVTLNSQQTCFEYEVQNHYSAKVFNFHYNHNIASINMVLYQLNSRLILAQTNFGIDYKHTLNVTYDEVGTYQLCFMKKESEIVEVSFEIIDEMDMHSFAGKEELSKVSRKISEFLMDIKRVGWTFKGVLEQHNSRKEKILRGENYLGGLMLIKVIGMTVIIGLQVYAVKKIFD